MHATWEVLAKLAKKQTGSAGKAGKKTDEKIPLPYICRYGVTSNSPFIKLMSRVRDHAST